MSQNIASFQDPDFRKCGVIMVAPKRNTFAMSCIYCESIFIRIQAFMRHLHQRHKEELQFEAEMEVYAVEELDADSEESGVADNDIATSEIEEDPKTKDKNVLEKIQQNVGVKNDVSSARHVAKEATLVNLDSTIVDRKNDVVESKDKEEEEGDANKKQQCLENDIDFDEKGMDMEANDFDMDSEFVKRIEMDLEMENKEDQDQTNQSINLKTIDDANDVVDGGKSFLEDEDPHTTLTEENQNKSCDNSALTKVSSFNNLLLSGLDDDTDDVEALLYNFENGVECQQVATEPKAKISDEKLENLEEELDEYNLNASILEQCLADDDLDGEKENNELEEKVNQIPEVNSKEEKAKRGFTSALNLQVMADWGMEDIDLEECMTLDETNANFEENQQVKETSTTKEAAHNISASDLNIEHESEAKSINDENDSHIESIPMLSKEDTINQNLLEVTPKTSMIYEEMIEGSETPKHNDSTRDYEGTNNSHISVSDLNIAHKSEAKSISDKNDGNIESIPTLPEEDTIDENLLEITPKASMNYEEIIESSTTTKHNDSTLECEGTNKMINVPAEVCVKRNSYCSPKADKIHTTKSCKTPIRSPRTPQTQKEKLFPDEVDKDINTPKSSRKTPRTSRIRRNEITSNINESPKEEYAKSRDKKSPVKEIQTSNKEMTQKSKNPINHTGTETPPLAENEKELETSKFFEGLTDENSSTHLYEETKVNSPEREGYTLQCLLNQDLEGEDLDTLINQLETSNGECLVGNPNESSGVAKMQKEDLAADKQDEDLDTLINQLETSNGECLVGNPNETSAVQRVAKMQKEDLAADKQDEDLDTLINQLETGNRECLVDNPNETSAVQRVAKSQNEDLAADNQVKDLDILINQLETINREGLVSNPNETSAVQRVAKIQNEDLAADKQDEDLDTLINQLETSNRVGLVDNTNETSAVAKSQNEDLAADKQDEDLDTLINQLETSNRVGLVDNTNETSAVAKSQNEDLAADKQDEDLDTLINQLETSNRVGLVDNTNETSAVQRVAKMQKGDLAADKQDEDLDTLINQLETSNRVGLVDNTNETSAVQRVAKMQKEDLAVDKQDDVLEEEMAIFNKFVNTEEQPETCESRADEEDDFENLLNADLSKALEKALGEDNSNSLLEEEDSNLKQNERPKVPSIENTMEESNENLSELHKDSADVKTQHLGNISVNEHLQQEKNNNKSKEEVPIKTDSNEFKGKYAKTNQKAKNIQGKPVKIIDAVITKKRQRMRKQSEKGVYSQTISMPENHLFNPFEQTAQTPKKFKENKENSPVEIKFRTNLTKSVPQSQMEHITDKMEKKINVPNCFINMQRGDKTPIKLSDLFSKQSPKTREKTGEKPRHDIIQRTPDGKSYKRSPTECKMNLKQMISSATKSASSAVNISSQQNHDLNDVNPNSHIVGLQTPQRLRNVSVKLQRYSSTQSLNKPCEKQINPSNNKSPRTTVQQDQQEKNIPLSALEKDNFIHPLKLPNCITISKVKTNTSPSTSDNCKQNLTEQQKILNRLSSSITVTKTGVGKPGRAREASIDVMPEPKSPKKNKLDYKSYPVSRSQRKQTVLKRMRSIKKQIFKPNVSQTVEKVVKSQLCKEEIKRRSLIKINSVQILPNVQGQVLTPLLEAQNVATQLEGILQGGQHSQITPKSTMSNSNKTPKSLSKSPAAQIENQGKSPEFISKSTTPEVPSTATIKANDISSTLSETSSKTAKTPTTAGVSLSKRPATSPLGEEQAAKRVHKSPNQMKLGTEETQLGLSKSVMDFLQGKNKQQAAAKNCDLKASSINLDGLLNEQPMPIEDMTPNQTAKKENQKENPQNIKGNNRDEENILHDLLQQVKSEDNSQDSKKDTKLKEKEAIPNANSNTRNEQTSSLNPHVEDYNNSKDLDILEKFGLSILVDTDAEDFYGEQDIAEMRAKAKKFADIFQQFKRLCSCSKVIQPVKEFQDLRTQVNSSFGENISINDMKRLINLLIIWYTNCYNNKLIHKKPVSESSNHYMLTFSFIPKITRRIHFCEFCDDNFNTEHKYYTHRIVHTGAKYPYMCKLCSAGFNRANMLKGHIECCLNQQYEVKMSSRNKTKQVETEKIYISNAETSTIEKKLRSNTSYKCKKCEISLSSEADAKLHINSCNSFQRRPAKITPRPKPKAEPYSRN